MNSYESIVILDQATTDETKSAFIEKMKNFFGEESEFAVEDWGRKRLAYEVKKQRDGYYLLLNFKAKAELIAEYDRILRIADNVLKHVVIKK